MCAKPNYATLSQSVCKHQALATMTHRLNHTGSGPDHYHVMTSTMLQHGEFHLVMRLLHICVGRAAPHTTLPYTFGAGGRASATDYAASSLCGLIRLGTVAPSYLDCLTVHARGGPREAYQYIYIYICIDTLRDVRLGVNSLTVLVTGATVPGRIRSHRLDTA